MLLESVSPIATFTMEYAAKRLERLKDYLFSNNFKTNTTQTTMQEYIELYSGPDVFIHFRYASVMN